MDDEGKQVGVLSKEEALKLAVEEEKDLVEIAPEAKPPVAKIIDFKKFKYLEEKKEKEARKNAKATELKEIRFSPFIGEHDIQTNLRKVKEFLIDGDLVKITIVFKGRRMAHEEFGPKLLERLMADLEGMAQQDRPPRMEGRRFVTIIKPTKAAKDLKQSSSKESAPEKTKEEENKEPKETPEKQEQVKSKS